VVDGFTLVRETIADWLSTMAASVASIESKEEM
jgi:hypothetical protein